MASRKHSLRSATQNNQTRYGQNQHLSENTSMAQATLTTSSRSKYENLVIDQPSLSKQQTVEARTLLTIPQVAAHLNVCRAHVYKLINQGLPTIHLGRAVRIHPVTLNNWLYEQEMSH